MKNMKNNQGVNFETFQLDICALSPGAPIHKFWVCNVSNISVVFFRLSSCVHSKNLWWMVVSDRMVIYQGLPKKIFVPTKLVTEDVVGITIGYVTMVSEWPLTVLTCSLHQ